MSHTAAAAIEAFDSVFYEKATNTLQDQLRF